MTAPPPRYGAIVLPDRLPDGKPAIGRGPATVTPPPTKRTKTDEAMTTPAPQRWPGGPPTIPTAEGPIAGAATCSIIRPPVARGPGAGSRGRFAGLPPAWNPTGTVTTAETVRAECRRLVAGDPRVCGPQATNVTSAMRDAVLRRWEVMKLVEFLPTSVMQRITGLSSQDFLRRSARDIVRFIFARTNAVEYTSIRKGRLALSRLLDYMAARDIP